MNTAKAEIKAANIVLLGDFNPRIFQPAWFGAEDLVRPKEAEEADITIVNNEVVLFSFGWCRIQVQRNQFLIVTTHDPYEMVRDLVLGVFRILSHTPLRRMGINVEGHFRAPSEEAWHRFGHALAPKDFWHPVLDNPGLQSLTIAESKRRDGLPGYVRVTVEPSAKIHPGIFVRVNDHYETEGSDDVGGATRTMEILETRWNSSMRRSEEIFRNLMEKL